MERVLLLTVLYGNDAIFLYVYSSVTVVLFVLFCIKWTSKDLIRMHECANCSGPSFPTYCNNTVFLCCVS